MRLALAGMLLGSATLLMAADTQAPLVEKAATDYLDGLKQITSLSLSIHHYDLDVEPGKKTEKSRQNWWLQRLEQPDKKAPTAFSYRVEYLFPTETEGKVEWTVTEIEVGTPKSAKQYTSSDNSIRIYKSAGDDGNKSRISKSRNPPPLFLTPVAFLEMDGTQTSVGGYYRLNRYFEEDYVKTQSLKIVTSVDKTATGFQAHLRIARPLVEAGKAPEFVDTQVATYTTDGKGQALLTAQGPLRTAEIAYQELTTAKGEKVSFPIRSSGMGTIYEASDIVIDKDIPKGKFNIDYQMAKEIFDYSTNMSVDP